MPLWPQTQKRLRRWLKANRWPPEAPLLPNRFGQRLTRAGAAYQLQQLVNRAAAQMPSLKKRHISPHSFRHSTAMALLEADVPTEVIALYLGHESPKTTHLYVEASLAMKKQALAKVEPPPTQAVSVPPRRSGPPLPGKPVVMSSSSTRRTRWIQCLSRGPLHNYHLCIIALMESFP